MARKLTDPILLVATGPATADVLYHTGFMAYDPVVFAKVGAKTFLVVPGLELTRAVGCGRGASVFTPEDLGLNPSQRREQAHWCLGLMARFPHKTWRVNPAFPFKVAQALQEHGYTLSVMDTACSPQRAVKKADEVSLIQDAQRAAVAAMNRAVATIRDSSISRSGALMLDRKPLTSERVRTVIDHELLKRECIAPQTIVAGGSQGADPHERGYGPLRTGEPIVIDIFPQHRNTGYWGDITRTVIKGEPSRTQRAMYNAVLAAQKEALAAVRPGVEGRSIHRRLVELFRQRGFETKVADGTARGFFHGTGHGVGLDIHEAPSIGQAKGRLRAGHVVTVEPGLYYPEHGGVRIEDTVEVTKDGCRILARCSKTFRV